jgi:hypothetical protein
VCASAEVNQGDVLGLLDLLQIPNSCLWNDTGRGDNNAPQWLLLLESHWFLLFTKFTPACECLECSSGVQSFTFT